MSGTLAIMAGISTLKTQTHVWLSLNSMPDMAIYPIASEAKTPASFLLGE